MHSMVGKCIHGSTLKYTEKQPISGKEAERTWEEKLVVPCLSPSA